MHTLPVELACLLWKKIANDLVNFCKSKFQSPFMIIQKKNWNGTFTTLWLNLRTSLGCRSQLLSLFLTTWRHCWILTTLFVAFYPIRHIHCCLPFVDCPISVPVCISKWKENSQIYNYNTLKLFKLITRPFTLHG